MSSADRAPDGVDRLDALGRRVDHLERRHVVERHDRLRLALARAQLVEHPVLRHLEEPRREAAAQREARQPLVDAEEDLLGQVLGERAVADHPQHVVEDRRLVRLEDDREGALVAPLRLAKEEMIGLRKWHA